MPKAAEQRSRRDGTQWSEILKRFEASGLGSRAFCRREGVSPSSFQRWRRRLREDAGGGFVELVSEAPATVARREWVFELALPHGVVLRMRA